MSKTVFKRLHLSDNMTAEEKVKLCASHINDLENNIEIIIDRINKRLAEVEK